MSSDHHQKIQNEIIEIVREQFQQLKSRFEGYSLRRFSKKIGVPAPILSQVLSGKRPLTQKLARKVLISLDINPDKKNTLIATLPIRRLKNNATTEKPKTELSFSEFEMVSDWWNFAILSLLDSGVKIRRAEELSERFGITVAKARRALSNLTKLELVYFNESFYQSTGKQFTTTTDIPNAYIRSNHLQGLELARDALENTKVSKRDFSAVTINCNPEMMVAIKKKTAAFRKQILKMSNSSPGSSIFRIQVQVYPLTKEDKK